MALYFECQINKNALLSAAFLAILPTGIGDQIELKGFSQEEKEKETDKQ